MSVKVAINGFGRIGRCVARIITAREDVELVAVNDTTPREMTVNLLKYDSVHGEFKYDVEYINQDNIKINGKNVRFFSDRDPSKLGFADCGADVVLECTGAILTREKAQAHIDNGIKKVVFSAPAKDDTPTFVTGVNTDEYDGQKIVSNASCTTNGLAPILKVIGDELGIQKGLMTTIHAYTNGQNLLDVKTTKDFRRARAAAVNMIPTTTGAAKAVSLVLPELKGKLHGQSVRVPIANVSMIDLTLVTSKDTSIEKINEILINASKTTHKNIIDIDNDYRVSSDFIGNNASTIVAPDLTQVICENMVKIMSWYDNEWGYSNRLVDLALFISK
ncbi:MAG: NAD-dependent glyceraldehyde-3-phosphate dehydrogenase (EC [uncultured Campylobacterales bacterium]|uniref:Glyceraldehyde-3-phosphate dehydrogenase n=1 Tax=uncultured Campylobacterales bacterium TaxID=352960 RepID=A0A6S6T0E6_9BACT|nr:MAG: NAD-dependent glyceraldehyde-3-phosphate dehydrogenase (EC [uncultured Campylobacterales bacterium]